MMRRDGGCRRAPLQSEGLSQHVGPVSSGMGWAGSDDAGDGPGMRALAMVGW